jgi:hypothetical protein
MIGCWFTSPIWLLTTSWVMVELSGNPTQLLCNEPLLIIVGCFSTPLCCTCLTISMKESHRRSSYCHSLALLILIDSLSLNTCYFDCWLRVVIAITTLNGTLLVLDSLSVIVALELTCLILNMFCTSMFLKNYLDLHSMLEQIIQG